MRPTGPRTTLTSPCPLLQIRMGKVELIESSTHGPGSNSTARRASITSRSGARTSGAAGRSVAALDSLDCCLIPTASSSRWNHWSRRGLLRTARDVADESPRSGPRAGPAGALLEHARRDGHRSPMEFQIGVTNLDRACEELAAESMQALSVLRTIAVGGGSWRYAYLADPDGPCVCPTETR